MISWLRSRWPGSWKAAGARMAVRVLPTSMAPMISYKTRLLPRPSKVSMLVNGMSAGEKGLNRFCNPIYFDDVSEVSGQAEFRAQVVSLTRFGELAPGVLP